MKKRILNTSLIIILMLMCYELLIKSSEIKTSILLSFDLWKNNLFPYLFPFFIISDLLINLNFIYYLNKYLKNIMYKLFRINCYSSFVFFMSIISGIPSNAKYINTLIKNRQMTSKDANKIILFTHFCNPLFILGFIGSILNKKISIMILFSHYITNIIIGLFTRNYNKNDLVKFNINKTTNNPLKIISSSIINSINTLLLILGVISFFSIVTTIINNNISSPLIKAIICSIFEITQGINNINILNISLKMKAIIITFIISFGGLSSHMQVMSILEDNNISYLKYLISRIIHAILASIILYFLI
ncbi:MAG TPA: hypothetical protein PLV83_05170 [Bacilli bacterium]|nr:hypothetical protein [Bacilli bacterium]